MVKFSQKFKEQSVDKALSRNTNETVKNIAESLGIGHKTLQKWVRLAKDNKLGKPVPMSKEKSPQDWSKSQRLDAINQCYSMNEEQVSFYCRQNGIYPHHLEEWKSDFLSGKQASEAVSRQEQKKLKQENKALFQLIVVYTFKQAQLRN